MPETEDEKRKRLERELADDPDAFRKKWGTDTPSPPSPTTPRKPDGTPAH